MIYTGVKHIYNLAIRKHLKKKIASYNGVAVRRPRLLDKTDVYPRYEEVLISHIRQYLQNDSKAVVVGGGLGVSSVVAVCSGADEVDTYEASSDRIETIQETLDLNKVSETVSLHHAIVESEIKIEGDIGSARQIDTVDLPSCDILILDCEGAERDILEKLTESPPRIIVECHPMFDIEPDEIVELLETMGHDIIDREIEQVNKGEVTIVSAEI